MGTRTLVYIVKQRY